MATAAFARDALMPPQPKGSGPGLALALLVHGGLIVALTFSVSWKASEPAGVTAELWSAVPQAAAPGAVEPESVAPPPPPPPPPPKATQPARIEPRPDAQIAEEKERLRREKLKAAQEEQDKKDAAKKREQQKQDQLKQEQAKKADADKKEDDRKRREAASKVDAETQSNRDAQLKRIMGMAGATGAPNATGKAQQSRGASSGYGGRIVAHLKPFNLFTETVTGNPRVEVEVRVGPSGTILGKKITRSSGVPSWDDAVMRTLDKAERLPLDTDGSVQNPTIISWGPND
jgi:colicin import membrane protein